MAPKRARLSNITMQEPPKKVVRKGMEEPWGYTMTKVAYDAVVAGVKTHEGRPADALGNVEKGHLIALRYNRCQKLPRVVCKVVEIRQFGSVRRMLHAIGWKKLVPWAASEEASEGVYHNLGNGYSAGMKAFRLEVLRVES